MTSIKGRFYKKKSGKRNEDREYTKKDFDGLFIIPKKILKLVGLRMAHDVTEYRAKCWNVFYCLEISNLVVGVISEFLGMVMSAVNATSFREGTTIFRMIPCFGTVVLSMFKSLKIKTNRSTFENIYYELREMWPTGEVTEEEHRIIRPVSRQSKYLAKAYYWCNNALLSIFLCPSYFFCLRRYLGYDAPMILPFDYLLPFNAFQPCVLEFILFTQTVGAVEVIWSNVAWDMLFCGYVAQITMQFELLSQRVRRLIYVTVDRQLVASYPLAHTSQEIMVENRNNLLQDETKQHKELLSIVKTHHKLIRLAADVEAMCSFALLVNFMNSTMIICFCGFCCVLLEKWNEIAYKSFFVIALSQTWLLCWFGQKLIDSSLDFSQALYECGWYNSSARVKSLIFTMLIRSQKCVRVTTYGFSTISLASYTMIIKTSWSYFTLLHNFYTR